MKITWSLFPGNANCGCCITTNSVSRNYIVPGLKNYPDLGGSMGGEKRLKGMDRTCRQREGKEKDIVS